VDSLFTLLKEPTAHQKVLSAPLRRLALAYLTQFRAGSKPFDPVARFHFSNGARLEAIDTFANLRLYGLRDSYGVMVNYRYVLDELEENHERYVRDSEVHVSPDMQSELRAVTEQWHGNKDSLKTGKKVAALSS